MGPFKRVLIGVSAEYAPDSRFGRILDGKLPSAPDQIRGWLVPDDALIAAHREALPPIHGIHRNTDSAPARNVMISIVDDDRAVREATNMLVTSLGYAAATFASAEEFLASGRLCETACLITDVQMPGMSGIDLQSHLTAHGHGTPVIFMTGYPEESLRARALKAGAFGFLGKPFSEDALIACLDRALEHHRSTSQE